MCRRKHHDFGGRSFEWAQLNKSGGVTCRNWKGQRWMTLAHRKAWKTLPEKSSTSGGSACFVPQDVLSTKSRGDCNLHRVWNRRTTAFWIMKYCLVFSTFFSRRTSAQACSASSRACQLRQVPREFCARYGQRSASNYTTSRPEQATKYSSGGHGDRRGAAQNHDQSLTGGAALFARRKEPYQKHRFERFQIQPLRNAHCPEKFSSRVLVVSAREYCLGNETHGEASSRLEQETTLVGVLVPAT